MRTMAVGILGLVAALGAAVAADAQTGAAQYGGAAANHKGLGSPTIGLTRNADGSVGARFGFAVRCHGIVWQNVVIKAHGKTTGSRFKVSGHTRLGRSRLTMTARGTFAATGATGHIAAHGKGCEHLHRAHFILRAAALPAGAPVVPPRGTNLFGVTSQSAAGVRLPVVLRVLKGRRVFGVWQALAACTRGHVPVMNLEPAIRIRSDGSFSRSEKYVIRYRDHTHDTFRVSFAGRFAGGGAAGTLSARVQTSDPRHHKLYTPCVTGTQNWSATP